MKQVLFLLMAIIVLLPVLSFSQPIPVPEESFLLSRGRADTLILTSQFIPICDAPSYSLLLFANPRVDSVYSVYSFSNDYGFDIYPVATLLPDSILDLLINPEYDLNPPYCYIDYDHSFTKINYDTTLTLSNHSFNYIVKNHDWEYDYVTLASETDTSLNFFNTNDLCENADCHPAVSIMPRPDSFKFMASTYEGDIAAICFHDSLDLFVINWMNYYPNRIESRDSLIIQDVLDYAMINCNFYWLGASENNPDQIALFCQEIDRDLYVIHELPSSVTPLHLITGDPESASGIICWEQVDSTGQHALCYSLNGEVIAVEVDSVIDAITVNLYNAAILAWTTPAGEDSIEVWSKVIRIWDTNVDEQTTGVPDQHDLVSCYPNPFNSSVTFTLKPSAQYDHLVIFDILGREVDRISVSLTGSTQAIIWNASGFSAGTYFARLEGNNKHSQAIRVMHLK